MLTDDELTDFGLLVGYVVKEVEQADPRVGKVHVLSLNETAPGHPHIHLVARFNGETTNPFALDENPSFSFAVSPEDICTRLASKIRTTLNR